MELLPYLYKSAIVLAVFYISYRFLLRKDTLFVWNRHFLLFGIVISLLIPFWEITRTVIVEIPASSTNDSNLLPGDLIPLEPGVVSNTASGFDPILVIAYLYIAGLLFFGIRWLQQAWSLLAILTRYSKFSVKGIYHVQVSEEQAPFSFLNYVVYNPNLHSAKELDMILTHEMVHIKERHSIDMIVSQLFTIVQWFNPFAWLYRKSIIENLEFLADRRTLPKVDCPKSYQLALLRTSSVTAAPILANSFYQSFIKKRIVMLNKNHSSGYNALKTLLVIPLLALFLYGFNLKTEKKFVEIPIESNIEKPIDKNKETDSKKAVLLTSSSKEEAHERKVNSNSFSTSTLALALKTVVQDIEFTINKKTSDAELESMKKKLKEEHNIDLNYSRTRNSSGEITSLSINYSGNGKNGSYQVTDDEGIEEFTFYMTEEGKTGFYSEVQEEERAERRAEMEERRMAMREEMEERREEIEERMEQRREEMEERREEMEERREELRIDLNERRDKQRVRMIELHEDEEHLEHKIRRIDGNGDSEVIVIDKIGEPVHYEIIERPETVIVRGHGTHASVITKNTTDAELVKMKEELAKKDITFNYRNVRRNSRGEIKSIKYTVKDENDKSTTNVKGGDDDAIDPIVIH